jgi:outer membrane protein assembly factor BamD (BamD/ComL family)
MSDTFRRTPRKLTDLEKDHIDKIKDAAERLETLIYAIPNSYQEDDAGKRANMVELALINLEQAVMWAMKAAT